MIQVLRYEHELLQTSIALVANLYSFFMHRHAYEWYLPRGGSSSPRPGTSPGTGPNKVGECNTLTTWLVFASEVRTPVWPTFSTTTGCSSDSNKTHGMTSITPLITVVTDLNFVCTLYQLRSAMPSLGVQRPTPQWRPHYSVPSLPPSVTSAAVYTVIMSTRSGTQK